MSRQLSALGGGRGATVRVFQNMAPNGTYFETTVKQKVEGCGGRGAKTTSHVGGPGGGSRNLALRSWDSFEGWGVKPHGRRGPRLTRAGGATNQKKKGVNHRNDIRVERLAVKVPIRTSEWGGRRKRGSRKMFLEKRVETKGRVKNRGCARLPGERGPRVFLPEGTAQWVGE